jgi:hypothetical protein
MDLEKSILKTLEYSNVFNFPLTSLEVYKYLIANKAYSYKQVKLGLKNLVKQKKVSKYGNYYGFKGLGNNIEKQRKHSITLCNKAFKRAQNDLKPIYKLFFVNLIAITGSVAAKNAKQGEDTDLFIITQKNFLWITRLIVVLFLKQKKLYKNPYCPNIYICENSLTWNTKNVYIANEIARLQPLFNKNNTYQRFLQKNSWVCEYLPNFANYIPKTNLKYKQSVLSYLVFPIEYILYKMQYFYMKKQITSEKIGLCYIHFLKNDYTKKVLSKVKD